VKNVSIIRAKPRPSFEQNVIDRDQSLL
jgi:hypothetical protein